MLMDARSIAATARNHGVLTAATDVDYTAPAATAYGFDGSVYGKRVYFGFGKADKTAELRFGPNITEWPSIPALGDDLLLRLDAIIHDEVTTTDELIPSGDASSYRSNPRKLATFTLSRREPEYVKRTAVTRSLTTADLHDVWEKLGISGENVQIGSTILPTSPATALPVSRPPRANVFWADVQIFAMNTPPSAIAVTASTGAWCRLRWMPAWSFPMPPETLYMSPVCGRRCSPAHQIFPQKWWLLTASTM